MITPPPKKLIMYRYLHVLHYTKSAHWIESDSSRRLVVISDLFASKKRLNSGYLGLCFFW